MARELNIRITADADNAKRELTQVEQILEKNTQAAERSQKTIGGESGNGGLVGVIGKLGGIMAGLGFVNAINKTIEWGGHLADLSAKTGITTEGLQRLELAGKLTGVSLEQMTSGVNMLQKRLAGGDDNAVRAVNALHLSLTDLLKSSPDEMMIRISEAIAKIPDPAERTRVAMELLGRSGAALLPVLTSNMREVGESAHVMSNEAVAGLDWFGDTLDKLAFNAKADFGSIVASFFSLTAAAKELDKVNGGLFGTVTSQVAALNTVGVSVANAGAAFNQTVPKVKSADEAMASLYKTMGTPEEQTKRVDAQIKHNEAIGALADTLTGKSVAKKVTEWSEALKLAEQRGGLTAAATVKLGKELDELVRQGAKLPPKLSEIYRAYETTTFNAKTLTTTTGLLTNSLDKQTKVTIAAVTPLSTYNAELSKMIGLAQLGFGPAAVGNVIKLGTAIKELPAPPVSEWQAFQETSKGILDRLQYDVAATVVSLIGHWSHWKEKSKEIWESIKNGISQVLTDLLYEFESRFIKGLINSITGAQGGFSSAFSGMFSGGMQSGASTAVPGVTASGSTAGTAFASGFNAVAGPAIAALIAWKIATSVANWIGGGPGDKYTAPDASTGYNPTPYYAGGQDPGNPSSNDGWGGMAGPPSGGVDPGYSGYGFAGGTGGRYLDFGRGTPVILHGRERVMTEAEGRQDGGASLRDVLDRTIGEWSEKFDRSLRQALLENRLHLQAGAR